MKSKIFYGVILLIVFLVVGGVYSYWAYPNKLEDGVYCMLVEEPVQARHPVLFFITDTFSNSCFVPNGWVVNDNSRPDSEKFSGVITSFKTDCAFDGECSIFVGNQEVVVISGAFMDAERPPTGKSEVNTFDQTFIGQTVEVYAQKIGPNRHTLVGSSDYYVKLSR